MSNASADIISKPRISTKESACGKRISCVCVCVCVINLFIIAVLAH